MAQTQGAETDGLALLGGNTIVVQAQDFDSLAAQVATEVAKVVALHVDATLIDITLAGGGAGGTYLATLITSTQDEDLPANQALEAMTFKFFEALDAHSLQAAMQAYQDTVAAGWALWAWDVAAAGVGAKWIGVWVTWNPNGGG
ncbi:MAG: hypothetical protein ACRENK_16360 [Gemmatimonadaceae bacterium]